MISSCNFTVMYRCAMCRIVFDERITARSKAEVLDVLKPKLHACARWGAKLKGIANPIAIDGDNE